MYVSSNTHPLYYYKKVLSLLNPDSYGTMLFQHNTNLFEPEQFPISYIRFLVFLFQTFVRYVASVYISIQFTICMYFVLNTRVVYIPLHKIEFSVASSIFEEIQKSTQFMNFISKNKYC